ncbi:MAG: hypothetical protein IPG93_10605 [Burkholderiales bacterium]|nr:hypothetical protein [Burkholderiales bacterium]
MTNAAHKHSARHAGAGLQARRRDAELAWKEGVRLRATGRPGEARKAYLRAVKNAPNDALYWFNLAHVELALHDLRACVAAAVKATELEPAERTYSDFLFAVQQDRQDFPAVIDTLDRFAQAAGEAAMSASWHANRCYALHRLGKHAESLHEGLQAFALTLVGTEQDAAERARVGRRASLLLGHSLAALRREDEAALCYRMAVDADPLALGSALYAVHYSTTMCDWASFDTDLARLHDVLRAVQALPPRSHVEDLSPFCLIGWCDDPALMRWVAENATGAAAARAPRWTRSRRAVPKPGGRIRLGLMSADFHRHATSMLMVQALENIDPDRYELYFYSAGPDDGTSLRARILATAKVVHEVASWSGARIVEQIEADKIGVLFDLKGFTKGARLDITAAHPAPLQVAWLGFPGTIGSDHIDYVIGDPIVTPLENQRDFTETIAQLPHCYQPNDSLRSRPAVWSRAQCGLPDDALVLASFNQPFKITPQMFGAWCRILQAVPRAVLWMLVPEDATRQRLCDAAAAQGITSERLIFAPFLEIESHRARLPQADLLLDTFPCSGHTTASDGLWAGVPLITIVGRTFAARVAASLLHTLGLDELVFEDIDSYVAKAITLCQTEGALAELRGRIAEGSLSSPLFDGVRFAADLQALIDRMVARQDAGLAPAPLPAVVAQPLTSQLVDEPNSPTTQASTRAATAHASASCAPPALALEAGPW